MRISFEVDIKKYKKAVAKGWYERFEEEVDPEQISLSNTPVDIQCAISQLNDDDFHNIEMRV